MSNPKISQETFDETLLENQDLFELSDEEAIKETIDQFHQQGIEDLESYIITSHPNSESGQKERHVTKKFESHLEALDQCVNSDGSIVSIGQDEAVIDKITQALEGIYNFCNGTVEELIGEDKFEKALPFLTKFHSSCSIFTLMSFLSVVDIDQDQLAMNEVYILQKTAKTLASIISPRQKAEVEIKTLIKDNFLAMERLLLLISYFTNMSNSGSNTMECLETLRGLIKVASAACKNNEKNKVAVVRAFKNSTKNLNKTSSIALLIQGLQSVLNVNKSNNDADMKKVCIVLMEEYCKLISVLCRYDDFRKDGAGSALGVDSSYGQNVSSSHDHVMEFNRFGVVPVLYEISLIALVNNDKQDSLNNIEEDMVSLAYSVLSATRVLAVNDEIVQNMVAQGVLKVVKMALTMGVKDVAIPSTEEKEDSSKVDSQRQLLSAASIGLIRNLCGNDEIKTSLCLGSASDPSSSLLPDIVKAMDLYKDNAQIQEHSLGTIAAMALRKPANAIRIIQENSPKVMIAAMAKFPNNVLIQRQGALAIRNIVSRLVANTDSMETTGTGDTNEIVTGQNESINVRDTFLDLGAEVILRQITGRHQGSVDEAYAALRDLGCEVSMVKYDAETQTMTRKTQMFGEVKTNFNKNAF